MCCLKNSQSQTYVPKHTHTHKLSLILHFRCMLEQSVTRSHLKPHQPLHYSLPVCTSPVHFLFHTQTPSMSHHSTHLHKLAKSIQEEDIATSMDPTYKKHPKSPPLATTITNKPHIKPQEPTNISYSPNVQNISNHFSRLYSNHKALSSSNPSSGGHPQCIDTHFQAKAMSLSTMSDGPVSSLIKGTRKYRKNVADLSEDFQKGCSLGDARKPINKSGEDNLDTKREIRTNEEIKKMSYKKERVEKRDEDIKKKVVVKETTNQELKRPSLSVAAGGRRRSFCSSQVELADFLTCNGVKVVSADMPPFMQIHAVDFARKTYDSLEKFTAKTLASNLKKEFDGVYGPAWHCIVGTSFGSFVTHSVGGFLYFSMDHKLYILLFKTTVQKAE